MSCLSDDQVAALVDGNAQVTDRDALLDHVASCDACQVLVADSMDSSHEEPLKFGRYEMQRAVAGGGMGTVFCAYDPMLRRLVAIKIIAKADRDRTACDQILREARALASLRHENVVAVHDVGVIEDEVFLAMEFIEGTSLQLARHRIADDAARLAIVADLTNGVAALHAIGLVHRDLKPSNIMITPAGRAIVLDLGLATERGAELGAAGTPGYVAPEVLDGATATPASDQYAWWRVVDELFAGSPRLAPLIARGTAKDPAQRFASIEEAFASVLQVIVPPHRRAVWPWLALTAAIATVAVVWAVHSSHARSFTACARTEGWDAAARTKIAAALQRRGFDAAKITAALDTRATQIAEQLTQACAETSIEHDRERLCLGLVWRENVQQIRAIGLDASRERVARAIDSLAQVLPSARCSDGNPPAQLPAITAAQREEYTALIDQIEAASQHLGKPSIAQLDALRPAIDRNGYIGLRLAWSSAIISELAFAGDLKRALAEEDDARHLAQTHGDDVRLGWLAVTRLRMTTTLRIATDDIEADLDAIQARVGSPLLSAEALQARAERAYGDGKLQRAVELLTSAIDLYASVSLLPAPGLRSAYITRAAALQKLGKLDVADNDLVRAVEVAQQRFAPGSAEIEEALGARANNLMYLGKLDEARTALQQLRAGVTTAHRDHTATSARIALSLCQIEMAKGTPQQVSACEDAVAATAAVYGSESPQVISPRNALAQVVMRTELAKGISILEETLRIGVHGGADPFDIPYAQGLLALAYDAKKRHADGCKMATSAQAILRTSPQVDMLHAIDAAFPELATGGHCR